MRSTALSLEAYGWADLIPSTGRKAGGHGALSPYKTPEQEEAEEDLLARFVALEPRAGGGGAARGIVRWLRPDYQIPKLGHKVKAPEDVEQLEAQLVVPAPADGKLDLAEGRDGPDPHRPRYAEPRPRPACIAETPQRAAFRGRNSARRTKGIEKALQVLVAAGVAQQGVGGQDGSGRYFIPR